MNSIELKSKLVNEKNEIEMNLVKLNNEITEKQQQISNLTLKLESIEKALSSIEIVINEEQNVLNILGLNDSQEEKKEIKSVKDIDFTVHSISDECRQILSTILIEELFVGGAYNRFVQYCLIDRPAKKLDKLITADQLIGFDFSKLNNINGLGVTKIQKIVDTFNDLIKSIDNGTYVKTDLNKQYTVELFNNINEEFENADIWILLSVGFSINNIKKLINDGYTTLKSLVNITPTTLRSTLKNPAITQLTEISVQFEKPLYDLMIQIITEINPRNLHIYAERTTKTLQEIGNDLGVSRERIRQLESDVEDIVRPYFELVKDQLVANKPNKDYFTLSELVTYVNNNDLLPVFRNYFNNNLEFIQAASVYVIKDDQDDSTDYKIKTLIESICPNVDKFSYAANSYIMIKELWNNGYNYIDNNNFKDVLVSMGYSVKGDTIYRYSTVPYGELCANLINTYFGLNGLKYTNSDISRLRELFKQNFGYDIDEKEDRNIWIRLYPYTVMRNLGVVTTANNIHIDQDLLDEIKTFIDNSSNKTIKYLDLYNMFKTKLDSLSNIDNVYFLHGVIKYYFSDDFIFNKRDYFTKR